MSTFSKRSLEKLATCDERLQDVMNRVVKSFDCTILTGFRTKEEQTELYLTGKSQLQWPHGKHNVMPSKALDAAPYPIDWKDRERASFFAGFVLGVASEMGISLRWGGDWNQNWQVRDNSFDDLWHFEIV